MMLLFYLTHIYESPCFFNITIHAYEIVIYHVMFFNPASSRFNNKAKEFSVD